MEPVIWRFWIVSIVLTIGPTNIISLAEGRQCYVCGYGSDVVFRYGFEAQDSDLFFQRSSKNKASTVASATTTPPPPRHDNLKYERPPSCLDFDHSDSFIRECPDGYLGCLTQIDGNEVIRTCDPLAHVSDCKVANKVTYCYCNGDLCNSRPASSLRIDDQSNYDAIAGIGDSGRGARGDDDTDEEDYEDEFSGMKPTEPFPGVRSDQYDSRTVVVGRGRSSSSTPGGGSRSTAVQGAMNANSHTPFHYPTTMNPDTASSAAGGCSRSSFSINSRRSTVGGLWAQTLERVLIAVALFVVCNRNRLMGFTGGGGGVAGEAA